ncbi:MAG TPA: CDP-alcohol phosphatidyltransferase family protein [bacterium]
MTTGATDLQTGRRGNRIWTAANALTASRILLLPFIIASIITQHRITALVIMLISLGTDIFDGYIARHFNQETEFGKILDPVVDKTCLAAILIALLAVHAIPLWVVLIIIARDLFILGGSFVIWRQRKFVFKANNLGRVAGLLFGALVCAFTINWTIVGIVILAAAVPVMMIAFLIYLQRYISAARDDSKDKDVEGKRGEKDINEKPV